jgi:transposase InsO family protein
MRVRQSPVYRLGIVLFDGAARRSCPQNPGICRWANAYFRAAEAGIEPSVGSVGDSYDNALAETINGLYKAEVIHRRSWKNLEAVELATLDWVHWFNHRRLLGPIGNIPSAEAEAAYYRHEPRRPRRRDSNQMVSGNPAAVQWLVAINVRRIANFAHATSWS